MSEHTFVYARPITDYDLSQRALLGALLEAHPRLLGIDELVTKLRDIPRMHEALKVLVGDGLVTRIGDRVGASRATVRFDALRRPN